MKTLIFLSTLLLTSLVGYSQIFTLQVFQYQEIVVNGVDTIHFNPVNVNLNYIFDLTNNNVSATINGKIITEEFIVYSNENSVITLVYKDNASAGWILNTPLRKVSYFEIRKDVDYSCEMTRVIFY